MFCEDIVTLNWKNLQTYDCIMKRIFKEALNMNYYDRLELNKNRNIVYKYLRDMKNQRVAKTMFFTLITVCPEINKYNMKKLKKKYDDYI